MDDAIARLARQINATRNAERLVVNADEVSNLRRYGAGELHRICSEFVDSVNRAAPEPVLDLTPREYAAEMFHAPGVNVIQISSEGRQLQIAFEATPALVSTEKFLVPYTLEGEVRTYNQKMLDRFDVRSRSLFFCVEDGTAAWRYYDWRTLSTGPLGRALLVSLMEPLF